MTITITIQLNITPCPGGTGIYNYTYPVATDIPLNCDTSYASVGFTTSGTPGNVGSILYVTWTYIGPTLATGNGFTTTKGFNRTYFTSIPNVFNIIINNFGTNLDTNGYQFIFPCNYSFNAVPLIISGTSFQEIFTFNNYFNDASINNWDTTNVTDMSGAFQNATVFNQPLNNWNTSNVSYMNEMFRSATSFNQPLNNWNTSNVNDISLMFTNATSFNQPLNNWNTSKVTDMNIMFYNVSSFNQNLNSWNTSNVTNMTLIFSGATSYNNTGVKLTWNIKAAYGSGPFTSIPSGFSDGAPLTFVLSPFYHYPCFKEGTKILTNKGYIPIENLRDDNYKVKTLTNGYKKIEFLGKRVIHHEVNKERIKGQLYKYSKKDFQELIEDLIITGCHSVLIDEFESVEQEEKCKKILNDKLYETEGKIRLPACIDDRADVYETKGEYNIYHLALENTDIRMNYGIIANGMLVETCSIRYLKEFSEMTLIENENLRKNMNNQSFIITCIE